MFTIIANGTIIYSDTSSDRQMRLVTAPKLSVELGKSGSLTFIMPHTHPSYSTITKFKTRVEVDMDGRLVFQGRVIEDEIDIYKNKSITCEGALSYLIDSIQAPREDEYTGRSLLTSAISSHNAQVEAEKRFTIGNVTVPDLDENLNKKVDQYQETKGVLDQFLVGIYGGYFVVRKQGSTNYLDYLKEYPITTTPQEVRLKSNILDIRKKEKGVNLFTKLIPTGKYPDDWEGARDSGGFMTIASVNSGKKFITHDASLAKYGTIVRVENFENPKSPTELLSTARKFMARYMDPDPTVLTIKAVDLHFIDSGIEMFILGNKYKIISSPNSISITLTLSSIKWDLQAPENTEFVFENPIQDLGEKALKKTDKIFNYLYGYGSGSDKRGWTGVFKFISETEDTLSLIAPKIYIETDRLNIVAEEMNIQSLDIQMIASGLSETGSLLEASIAQTAEEIRLSAAEIVGKVKIHEAYIKVERDRITQEVINRESKNEELRGKLLVESGRITTAVSNIRDKIAVQEGLITQEKDRITQEVLDRSDADSTLRGNLTIQQNRIATEISRIEDGLEIIDSRIETTSNQIVLEVNSANLETLGLQGRITQLDTDITTEVGLREGEYAVLLGRINVASDAIDLEVIDRTDAEEELQGKINIQSGRITSEVSARKSTGSILTSRITNTKNNITLEVSNRAAAHASLSSSIDVSESGINLRVKKSGVTTAINLSPEGVNIQASKLDVDGIILAKGLILSGELSGLSANFENLKIGDFIATGLSARQFRVFNSLTTSNLSGMTVTAGAIDASTITSTNCYATTILLDTISLQTILDGKLGMFETAANANKLGTLSAMDLVTNADLWALNNYTITNLEALIEDLEVIMAANPNGILGPVGLTGGVGSAGERGDPGDPGPPGYRGSQGNVGLPGPLGTVGFRGDTGATGSTGPRGSVGATGIAGATGVPGDEGYYGSQGYRGSQGYQGSQALTGMTGTRGVLGDRGDTGDRGALGSQGPVGATGATGVPGVPGDEGYYGSQGYRGSQGYQGSQALTGQTGDRGTLGAMGPTGDRGLTGERGPMDTETAPKGSVGYTGSKGPTGAAGAVGFKGSKGYAGESGASSPQGYQGAVGDSGDQGSRGNQGGTGYKGSRGYTGSKGYKGSKGLSTG